MVKGTNWVNPRHRQYTNRILHAAFYEERGNLPTPDSDSFPTTNDPSWTAAWKNSLFCLPCCSSHPVISCEACFCYPCVMGMIGNVLSRRKWKESEWCNDWCSRTCCSPCTCNIYNGVFGGSLREGVMARYNISSESSLCGPCCTAFFCPCCNANQMVLEMTEHGEFPGGVACASRPSNCPERPPPTPVPLGEIQNAITVCSQDLNTCQAALTALEQSGGDNERSIHFKKGHLKIFNEELQILTKILKDEQQNQGLMSAAAKPPSNPLHDNNNSNQGQPVSDFVTWDNVASQSNNNNNNKANGWNL